MIPTWKGRKALRTKEWKQTTTGKGAGGASFSNELYQTYT